MRSDTSTTSRRCWALLLALLLPATPAAAVPAGYALVLADEFDGPTLDPAIWEHRLPGPRRDAVNTPEAVRLADGRLMIDTWTEDGVHYTGMIGSQGRFEQQYGWFEARIDFDDAPGMWSAFWLQSPDMGSFLGDPGRAGVEMDIVEHDLFNSVATEPIWHAALHWDGYGSEHQFKNGLIPMPGIGDGFHTYALEWTPTTLRFFYDDQLLWEPTGPISHRPEFLILSSEVEDSIINRVPAGGYGTRAESTTRMVVDYVRVYQAVPEPGASVPALLGVLATAAMATPRRRHRC
ncbi:MAG: glycoside hydrolase family 16 protein [Myxococcales bacterium]|nr:glycoside hydrolase family 16 protein [Myxococcales bacterium]